MKKLTDDNKHAEEKLWDSYRDAEARERAIRRMLTKTNKQLITAEVQCDNLQKQLKEEVSKTIFFFKYILISRIISQQQAKLRLLAMRNERTASARFREGDSHGPSEKSYTKGQSIESLTAELKEKNDLIDELMKKLQAKQSNETAVNRDKEEKKSRTAKSAPKTRLRFSASAMRHDNGLSGLSTLQKIKKLMEAKPETNDDLKREFLALSDEKEAQYNEMKRLNQELLSLRMENIKMNSRLNSITAASGLTTSSTANSAEDITTLTKTVSKSRVVEEEDEPSTNSQHSKHPSRRPSLSTGRFYSASGFSRRASLIAQNKRASIKNAMDLEDIMTKPDPASHRPPPSTTAQLDPSLYKPPSLTNLTSSSFPSTRHQESSIPTLPTTTTTTTAATAAGNTTRRSSLAHPSRRPSTSVSMASTTTKTRASVADDQGWMMGPDSSAVTSPGFPAGPDRRNSAARRVSVTWGGSTASPVSGAGGGGEGELDSESRLKASTTSRIPAPSSQRNSIYKT
jgi:hypothetical protein